MIDSVTKINKKDIKSSFVHVVTPCFVYLYSVTKEAFKNFQGSFLNKKGIPNDG